jgi:hypothetical protein
MRLGAMTIGEPIQPQQQGRAGGRISGHLEPALSNITDLRVLAVTVYYVLRSETILNAGEDDPGVYFPD